MLPKVFLFRIDSAVVDGRRGAAVDGHANGQGGLFVAIQPSATLRAFELGRTEMLETRLVDVRGHRSDSVVIRARELDSGVVNFRRRSALDGHAFGNLADPESFVTALDLGRRFQLVTKETSERQDGAGHKKVGQIFRKDFGHSVGDEAVLDVRWAGARQRLKNRKNVVPLPFVLAGQGIRSIQPEAGRTLKSNPVANGVEFLRHGRLNLGAVDGRNRWLTSDRNAFRRIAAPLAVFLASA